VPVGISCPLKTKETKLKGGDTIRINQKTFFPAQALPPREGRMSIEKEET